ncbi:hypothetical protein DRJ16_03920 [Candidatus Woesearchaeota archaeon]|nr:MAG: hypothetical protein DRJ16_03920 [Candidatus Woesearchaeota archaeon]
MRVNRSVRIKEEVYHFSKKMKIILFSLLIVLNLILRIPFFPHEYGSDSFVIHIVANSVSEFGYARWWLNPLSIFGLYPFSVCSSVPFILSGISQSTDIDVEHVIWLLCMFLGLLNVFAGYIMAEKIMNDDLFKLLVAFCLSTSPAVLNYLTWTITTRAPFIGLLPLFIYSLFKCRAFKLRFGFLTTILFILLFATHHLVYFLIPVIIGYFVVIIFHKFRNYITIRIPEKFTIIAIFISFIIMFAIPFFTGHFIEGSRYGAIIDLFLGNLPRYAGILGIYAVGGFFYLLYKSNKRPEEWSLLLILLFLTPFLYIETYMKWFIPCFISLFVGVGLVNTLKLKSDEQKKRYVLIIIIIFLLLSVSFSGFYQHWRTKGGKIRLFTNYMKDSTYSAGLWAKENVEGTAISNNILIGIRFFAVSEVPLMSGYFDVVDLSYGLANTSDLKLIKRSITSENFWFDGPYAKKGGYSSKEYWEDIMGHSYSYYKSSKYPSIFNFTHFIEYKSGKKPPILHYIQNNNFCIYDNGEIIVWKVQL